MSQTIEQRALQWALSDDTGISSKTLCAHMTGNKRDSFYSWPPSDADDRGRCIRLLKLIPEWIPRLPELADFDTAWKQQIPLIIKEGGFDSYESEAE